MKTADLVSVVIPIFNGASYLESSIGSALAQTHTAVEVIAVNDGSTDRSAEILARFGKRIRVVEQDNAGVAIARNVGMVHARGEFIAFLDQDDYWHSEKLAAQVARFHKSARIGLVHTAVAYLDDATSQFVGPENRDAHPEQMVGNCFETLILGNPLCNSSVVVRRSIINQLGGCDLRIRGNTVQDYDLWLRVSRVSEFDYIDRPLTVFRLHSDQGHWHRRAMLAEELKVLLRHAPLSEWYARTDRRTRLSQLYDALGTAHIEAQEPRVARRYFGRALLAHRSGRQLFRFAASLLPFPAVQYVRRQRQTRRDRRLKEAAMPLIPTA